ncbi:hypothetical protein ACFXJ8_17130 [Nonomuraea sp. NPDC059194]|uniref:hypothetical protein n=1 Tax=Nonomuraea sp. NPDC059194 TaxID=3346764 RepID=UPI0036C11BCC
MDFLPPCGPEKQEKPLCLMLCFYWVRPAARWASLTAMLTTRPVRFSGPGALSAGQPLSNVLVALAMVIAALFAHGGGCAAMVLSEASAHSSHIERRTPTTTDTSMSSHDNGCSHRRLPAGHPHGTEEDCAATSAAGTSATCESAIAADVCASQHTRRLPARAACLPQPFSPDLAHLCVMRI